MKRSIFIFKLIIFLTIQATAQDRCENVLFQLDNEVASIVFRDGVHPKTYGNRYTTNRGMFEYLGQFESLGLHQQRPSLAVELSKLNHDDVVIDFGSGEGYAVEQLASMNTKQMIEELSWRDFADRMDWRGEIINTTKLPYLLQNYDVKNKVLLSPLSQEQQAKRVQNPGDFDAYLFWKNILSYTEKPVVERPTFVSLTYEIRRDPTKIKNVTTMYGKILEHYRPKEIPMYSVGIMYYGVAAYSKNWNQMFQILFSRLKTGGKLFIYGAISDIVYSELNPSSNKYETRKMKWGEFFQKYSKNIRVEIDPTSVNNITITKLHDHVEIPLLTEGFNVGETESPPYYDRKFTGSYQKIGTLID